MEFEFALCNDCYHSLETLTSTAALLGDTGVPVEVLSHLCGDCADSALRALQGGPAWN